jgi:hypothetical protein
MREPKVRAVNGLRVRLPGDARRRAAAVATVDRRMALLEARRAGASPPADAAVPPATTGSRVTPDLLLKPGGIRGFGRRILTEAGLLAPSSGNPKRPSEASDEPLEVGRQPPKGEGTYLVIQSHALAAGELAAMSATYASTVPRSSGSGRFVPSRRARTAEEDVAAWLLDSVRDRPVVIWVEQLSSGTEIAPVVVANATQELLSRSRELPHD